MPPKEETTQITIGGKTITQAAELSAVPEADVMDGTMAEAAQQLTDALVAFGKALADQSTKRRWKKLRYDQFYACPYCGSALDPGERCDCQDQKKKEEKHADSKDTTRKDAGASEHRAIQIAG